VLGLALAKGRGLTELFHLYWEMKNEIFMDASTMSRLFGSIVDRQTSNLQAVLEKCFEPTDTFLTCRKRLTVPALNIATSPARVHVFRNYKLSINDKPVDDVTFRDAARASSAAPTYFHPHLLGDAKLVDGSFVANCPLNILFQVCRLFSCVFFN
jgi:predicted acylesterase/phospholipase RssA